MKQILIICCFFYFSAAGQTVNPRKADIKKIKKHIEFLTDDKLEGRRTGTKGEELAAAYLVKQFKKAGIQTAPGFTDFIQPFDIKNGKVISSASLVVNEHPLLLNEDFFPLAWSGNGNITEKTPVTFYDIAVLIKENETSPHYEL